MASLLESISTRATQIRDRFNFSGTYLEEAEVTLRELKIKLRTGKGDESPDTMAAYIESTLQETLRNHSDQREKCDAIRREMNTVMEPYRKAQNLHSARELFEHIKAGKDFGKHNGNIDSWLSYLNGCLERAHTDMSALDPEGRKSAQTMEKELHTASVPYQVEQARYELKLLKDGLGDTYWIPRITKRLNAVGKDLSALDPEGKKSADDMLKEMNDLLEKRGQARSR